MSASLFKTVLNRKGVSAPALRARRLLGSNGSILFLVGLVLLFGVANPNFLSLDNLYNVLDLASLLIMTTLGMAFVLELGSIDLSVEGSVALTGIVSAMLVRNIVNSIDLGYLAVLIGVLVGTLFGFLNGFIHTRYRIPSFMATLGIHFIMMGIGVVVTRGEYIVITDLAIRQLGIARLSVFPVTLLIAALIAALMWVLGERMTFGRYVLAIGGDEGIVRDMGIDVDRIKVAVFSIAGTIYGLAGVLLTFKLGAGDTWSSYGYTFETISACVVGGISITGGIGSIKKAVIGAFLITVFRSGMVFLGINPRVQAGIMGLIIITAVFLTIDRSKLKIMK